VVMETIRPLLHEAEFARGLFAETVVQARLPETPSPEIVKGPRIAPEVDPERVRAAITVALDAALPAMIREITERVLVALGH